MGCIDCAKSAKDKYLAELNTIYKKIENEFRDKEEITTVAIVKTKNGFLSYREYGHDSLNRLETVQYVFVFEGIIVG